MDSRITKILNIIQVVAFVLFAVVIQFVYFNLKTPVLKWNPYLATFNLFLLILSFPLCLLTIFGVLTTSLVNEKSRLQGSMLLANFITLRVLTNGDDPEKIRKNVFKNIFTCLNLGFDKFFVEVITSKPLNLPKNPFIREIISPLNNFKVAFLKSLDLNCLNFYDDDDSWILCLNENTLITEDSLRDVLNFTLVNRSQIGIGAVRNNFDTILNSLLNMESLYVNGKNLLVGKFSFLYNQLVDNEQVYLIYNSRVERDLIFDQMYQASMDDKDYFLFSAMKKGYLIDWIKSEMISDGTIVENYKFKIFKNGKLLEFKIGYFLKTCGFCSINFLTLNCMLNCIFNDFRLLEDKFQIWNIFFASVNIYVYLIGAFKSYKLSASKILQFFTLIILVFLYSPIFPFVNLFSKLKMSIRQNFLKSKKILKIQNVQTL
ncbi:unnamed protein product [Brachionus calyciflorus]|uniref:Uncharacterized protein n=1 Tax=Brachionus calyciflorus TaxID=104777 RepID=A0A813NZE7_9BILA|nr:unnamed protein product [Brachionus calyciflorus]